MQTLKNRDCMDMFKLVDYDIVYGAIMHDTEYYCRDFMICGKRSLNHTYLTPLNTMIINIFVDLFDN